MKVINPACNYHFPKSTCRLGKLAFSIPGYALSLNTTLGYYHDERDRPGLNRIKRLGATLLMASLYAIFGLIVWYYTLLIDLRADPKTFADGVVVIGFNIGILRLGQENHEYASIRTDLMPNLPTNRARVR